MQLVQFAAFSIHACFPLFIECDFPAAYSYVILLHGVMFFALFYNFYIQAYVKRNSIEVNGTNKKLK